MKCLRCKKIEVGSIPQECSRCRSKNGLPIHRQVYVPPPARGPKIVMPERKPKIFELDSATDIIEHGFRRNHKVMKRDYG